MKIRCLHGYFIIEETRVGQVSEFMSLTGLEIAPVGNYYTFAPIQDAPEYTLLGKEFLGIVATKNFEGKPWEVFEANGVVYDFDKGLVVPIASVTQTTVIQTALNRFISPGLILPGSLTDDGSRVKDYAAWYSVSTQRFSYSEVSYV